MEHFVTAAGCSFTMRYQCVVDIDDARRGCLQGQTHVSVRSLVTCEQTLNTRRASQAEVAVNDGKCTEGIVWKT